LQELPVTQKKKLKQPDPNLQTSLFSSETFNPDDENQLVADRINVIDPPEPPRFYTVSELTLQLKECLSDDPVLGNKLVVKAQLSNVKQSGRGHVYLTLKDEHAAMSAVIWASTAKAMAFELKDGLEVYATGDLEVYVPNGTYSLVIRKIEPVGVGSLQLAFEQIKARLDAEGLFDERYKQALPLFPLKLGIVTSPTGAVIHDMLRVIRRKNPNIDVLIAPAKVQGEGADQEIASAIMLLNQPQWGVEVIIVARGGGSFEDLFSRRV
jgi:exodeoxyribonuclease VII large subunit